MNIKAIAPEATYLLLLSDEAYEILQEIAEQASRMGYERNEIDRIFENVVSLSTTPAKSLNEPVSERAYLAEILKA